MEKRNYVSNLLARPLQLSATKISETFRSAATTKWLHPMMITRCDVSWTLSGTLLSMLLSFLKLEEVLDNWELFFLDDHTASNR